jgi:hypothetical protein
MAGEGHAIERACRITGVSHAGYYMWRLARRVHAELTLGRGVKVGHNAVEM